MGFVIFGRLHFSGTKMKRKICTSRKIRIKNPHLNMNNTILALPYWLFNILFTP